MLGRRADTHRRRNRCGRRGPRWGLSCGGATGTVALRIFPVEGRDLSTALLPPRAVSPPRVPGLDADANRLMATAMSQAHGSFFEPCTHRSMPGQPRLRRGTRRRQLSSTRSFPRCPSCDRRTSSSGSRWGSQASPGKASPPRTDRCNPRGAPCPGAAAAGGRRPPGPAVGAAGGRCPPRRGGRRSAARSLTAGASIAAQQQRSAGDGNPRARGHCRSGCWGDWRNGCWASRKSPRAAAIFWAAEGTSPEMVHGDRHE
mmetsp:Transcript_49641/g.130902  ORF Transcript_49641/g.130902 Transcript_49641/m.130902 type:complete len:258 (-) Transcript_49641:226-999(-)